nr:hypothetical protein [Pelobacter seleniigenes]
MKHSANYQEGSTNPECGIINISSMKAFPALAKIRANQSQGCEQ